MNIDEMDPETRAYWYTRPDERSMEEKFEDLAAKLEVGYVGSEIELIERMEEEERELVGPNGDDEPIKKIGSDIRSMLSFMERATGMRFRVKPQGEEAGVKVDMKTKIAYLIENRLFDDDRLLNGLLGSLEHACNANIFDEADKQEIFRAINTLWLLVKKIRERTEAARELIQAAMDKPEEQAQSEEAPTTIGDVPVFEEVPQELREDEPVGAQPGVISETVAAAPE